MNKVETIKKNRESGTVFLMTFGVLLAWSIVAALISTTTFNQGHVAGLVRIFVTVGVIKIVFSSRKLLWVCLALIASVIIFVGIGFITYPVPYYPYEYYIHVPNRANQAADFIRRTILYVIGDEFFSPGYDTAVIWVINIAVGLFVAIFGYFKFKFLILFLVPAAIFSILLTSRFFNLRWSFFVFIFCGVAYLIKHLNLKCSSKSNEKASYAMYALYVALFCVGIGALLPVPGRNFRRDLTHTFVSRPFHFINDEIYFTFGPRYFSLGQIGFGGGGGRLGGDIQRHERLIMRLRADGDVMPAYLTGAILDTYTGGWWLNSFWGRTPVDFDDMQQNIELHERAASQVTAWLLDDLYPGTMSVRTYFEERIMSANESIGRQFEDIVLGLGLEVDWSLWVDVWEIYPELDPMLLPSGVVLPGLELEDILVEIESSIHMYFDDPIFADLYYEITFIAHPTTGEVVMIIWPRMPPGMSPEDFGPFIEHFYLDIGADMFETRTLEIDILGYRTFSVFYAGILQGISSPNQNISFYRDTNGRVVAYERMPRNTRYFTQFSDLNDFILAELDEYGQGEFPWSGHGNMLRYSYRGVLRDISDRMSRERRVFGQNFAEVTLVHDGFEIPFEDFLNDYLIPRADWIYETYTELPSYFPERIRDLALSITAGAANDYERARLLEAYLTENFEYTLLPGFPPPNRDFVDHFLFDLRMGYCTYFATAFVVMARSLGMPARYVEGFLVRGIPDEHGFYNVMNTMGHAWGEVYFEGFGWHRFEPTPAEGLPQPYIGAGFQVPGDSGGPAPPWYLDYLDLLDHIDMLTPGQDMGAVIRQPGAAEDDDAQDRFGLYLIILAAALALGAVAFRAVRIYRRNMLVHKKGDNEAVRHYFGVLLKYMKFFGYAIKPNETAGQFADRVGDKIRLDDKTFCLKDIAEIFAKARYSNHAITPEEREIMENAVMALDTEMQHTVNRGMYLYYKYMKAIV
ncbi:MAG: transglutaminase domain-containing protein [Oscillospiraceae bacterium]|nr:transglutaminase domain-containing protein [Oscillospiraceae bacterium]